ncbi:MAG: response regulator [Elusimicrobiota bacterium]
MDNENVATMVAADEGASRPLPQFPTARVLVVDDESGVRAVCVRTLRGLGSKIESAENGEAALAMLGRASFDLVLTDISMPGKVDGVRLCWEVKSRSPSTDVVVMTAYPSLESAVATLKKGAYDYLVKPFTPQSLEAVVSRCLQKRQLSAELDRERTLRRELEAAYAELQKLERLKDAFLGRLSHEMRTPLAVVLMATEASEDKGTKPEERKKFLGMIGAQLGRLGGILEDLLSYSEMCSHDPQAKRSAVRAPEVISRLVARYRPLWEEKGLKVDVSFSDRFPTLQADPDLLETALRHLLLNAIYFNRPGGSITVRGEASAEETRISFKDTGIGIPREALSTLGDGFYQAAGHLTRQVGGLGLGLAIVRRIAKAHGGRVSVRSEDGKGSEFILALPAADGRDESISQWTPTTSRRY